MDYDFTSREREFGRVVFALALDIKRMTERVVIGKAEEAQRRLDGRDGDVYYDETRPLGSLLLTFEADKDAGGTGEGYSFGKATAKASPLKRNAGG